MQSEIGTGIINIMEQPQAVVENHNNATLVLNKGNIDLFWDDLKRKKWLRFQFTNLKQLYTY